MKKPVTYLGDAFFYFIALLTLSILIWIVITPAKYFLFNEIQKVFQNKGELRAKNKFNQILLNYNINRENFKPTIIIRKKSRELSFYANSIKIATYTIGLGRKPTGAKLIKDDLKTPEGNYYICNKILNHKYHMFLQINYPSNDDATRGIINHIITNKEQIDIAQADSANKLPPSETALGGNIGIHGFGSESCWTKDGSISMENIDIEEIYWNTDIGCPVTILP